MKSIYTPKLIDILPDSVLADKKLRASAEALDFELGKLSVAAREVLHLPRLDELNGAVLDFLAEAFHIDFYEPLYLSDAEKKNLIRDSIAWHRVKGTVWAVDRVANDYFSDAEVHEWFQYGYEAEPIAYHFLLHTQGYTSTPEAFETFLRRLWDAKNVRSWLDKIIIQRKIWVPPIYAGAADVITGTIETFPATPKPSTLQKIRVGQIFRRSGEIIFQANLDDLERFARIHESAIADLLIVDIGIARPGDLQTETVNEKISHKTTIKVGSVFVRQGQIIIKPSDTQIPPGAPSYARTYAGTAETHRGTIEIKPATPKTPTAVLIRVGRVFVRQGQIVIKPSEVQIPDDEELPADGDWIRLYFNFATGRDKPVLLKNPRADLVKGDIYELGEFAQDNVVFKNSRAEGTLGIDRVDLIKGYALSDGVNDSDTLPAADKIRLFFDFPDGNDHKIMMRNVRAGITLGELKALSTTATENRLLLNARNEPTTGLRNVALVKNIRVSTGSMSEPVSF